MTLCMGYIIVYWKEMRPIAICQKVRKWLVTRSVLRKCTHMIFIYIGGQACHSEHLHLLTRRIHNVILLQTNLALFIIQFSMMAEFTCSKYNASDDVFEPWYWSL